VLDGEKEQADTPAGPTADWEIDLVTAIGERACRVPQEEGQTQA